MLPGIFGFKWEAGHLIFVGVFISVLLLIAGSLVMAIIRVIRDFRGRREESLRWHADFEDLPRAARKCRHEFTGEFNRRTCTRAFDCRECAQHAELVARAEKQDLPAQPQEAPSLLGFDMPSDRLYHRGHTWMRAEQDGTLTVGLDGFASHLLGRPDKVELPMIGKMLLANGTGWTIRKGSSEVRVLSPMDGEVVELGAPELGWYLKLRPPAAGVVTTHLLTGHEIQPWLLREMERLQIAMSVGAVGASLADGGLPVEDPSTAYPQADWDSVWDEIFLQP